MPLLIGWSNLQTMNINISSESSLVKFSSILPGEVFRTTDYYHCCLKIQDNTGSDINAIDLETNLQWHFDNGCMVYKAKSANLSINF